MSRWGEGLFLIEQRAGVGGAITLILFTSYRSTWATRAKKKIYEIWQNACAIRTISGSIFVVFKATLNIKLRTEKEKEREQEADRREEGKIASSWSEAGGERERACVKVPLVFFQQSIAHQVKTTIVQGSNGAHSKCLATVGSYL